MTHMTVTAERRKVNNTMANGRVMAEAEAMAVPELALTERIRNALNEAEKLEQIDVTLKAQCKQYSSQPKSKKVVIPIRLLRDVFKLLRSHCHHTDKKFYLHELVEDADFVLKERSLPPRDPELEARIQKLKIKEENREYRRMTQNVDPSMQGSQRFNLQSDVKSMNRQLTSVLNFLITVAAGFAFGYKLIEYTYGRVLPLQMMVGLLFGTVIFFVDLYFMVKYTPL